ncbi:MAG: MGMT family protein, partial [Candidatus Nitrosopolaris sp.]
MIPCHLVINSNGEQRKKQILEKEGLRFQNKLCRTGEYLLKIHIQGGNEVRGNTCRTLEAKSAELLLDNSFVLVSEFLQVEELKDEKDGAEKYESFV